MSAEAWFSALGEPLGDAERAEIAAYLSGLALEAAVHAVSSWREAFEICAQPAEAWWRAEEAERIRLQQTAKLNPADPEWLSLNETLHGAAAVAAARVPAQVRPILRRSLAPGGIRGAIRHFLNERC